MLGGYSNDPGKENAEFSGDFRAIIGTMLINSARRRGQACLEVLMVTTK
jgi:hypothetical protein